MSTLKLEIDEGRTHFRPGETIEGRAAWHLDTAPEVMEARLFWHTSGKGTRDTNVVESVELQGEDTWGDVRFSFQVPEGPYSFSGSLVTLNWAIELVAEPSDESFAVEITIGLHEGEIDLYAADADA